MTKALVATRTEAGSKPRPRGKSRCPKRSAHPGMTDTYGCPLKNLPNRVKIYTVKTTQWPKFPRVN